MTDCKRAAIQQLNVQSDEVDSERLMKLDLAPALATLQAIEQEAWADGVDVDLVAQ